VGWVREGGARLAGRAVGRVGEGGLGLVAAVLMVVLAMVPLPMVVVVMVVLPVGRVGEGRAALTRGAGRRAGHPRRAGEGWHGVGAVLLVVMPASRQGRRLRTRAGRLLLALLSGPRIGRLLLLFFFLVFAVLILFRVRCPLALIPRVGCLPLLFFFLLVPTLLLRAHCCRGRGFLVLLILGGNPPALSCCGHRGANHALLALREGRNSCL
jgi:hypothetical protein